MRLLAFSLVAGILLTPGCSCQRDAVQPQTRVAQPKTPETEVGSNGDTNLQKSNAAGTSLDGHLFLHLNPPAKVWITGFDVNSDSQLYDFGVPSFVAIDISKERWVYSTGGSEPRDIQDPGTLQLSVAEHVRAGAAQV